MLRVSAVNVDVDDVIRVTSKVNAIYRFNGEMKADSNDMYEYIKKLVESGLIKADDMKLLMDKLNENEYYEM